MTKTPINYSNTVIYKIVCNDLTVTDLYVGSTTAFTKRKNIHKSKCYNVNDKNYNLKVYQMIRANGGWSNWTMIEIEKYPCNDGNEARARERYHFEFLNASMNMQVPSRSRKEYKIINKELISIKNKNYRENNKDKEQQYRDNNKERKKEYDKQYRENNKDKINEQRRELRKLKKQDQIQ
jgi:hypothetical protein